MADTITREHHAEFSIKNIVPRAATTRSHSKATETALMESIREFGLVEPILLDSNHRVIHGQFRYEAAKKLKMKSVPVIVVSGMDEDEAAAYHLLANQSVNWHQWIFPETDKVLADLDGGLTTENILGYEAPSENGKWRDLMREIGWFIEIMPENLSASTVNLDKLAMLLQNQLSAEKGKYQFDDNQLLYMEGMRRQLKELRDEMLAAGEITEEEYNEIVETFDAKRELRYSVKKQQEWEAANAREVRTPEDLKMKRTADGKMMGLTMFVTEFGPKFCGMTQDEANRFFNSVAGVKFDEYCQKVIGSNPVWDPETETLTVGNAKAIPGKRIVEPQTLLDMGLALEEK